MEKKEDQRKRITKQMLQNAMLELLQQKPLQALTVKDLCEKAGVNRGTFYLHYLDIFDLQEKMEDTLLQELQDILNTTALLGPAFASENFITALFRFFEKNREMCTILLGEHGDKMFVQRIIEVGRAKSLQEYTKIFPHATTGQTNLYYTFVANGFLGLLQYSIQQGVPFEALAQNADRLLVAAVHFFDET